MTPSTAGARVDLVHGPMRLAPAACSAYHGILPRGLEHTGVDTAAWPLLAPELDRMLGDEHERAGATDQLAELLAAARAEGVLAYRDSARAAVSFVRDLAADEDRLRAVADAAGEPEPDRTRAERIELWSVREGTTSSVWRVELDAAAWEAPIVLALDVARGSGAAAAELRAIAAELARMRADDARRINRVVARDEVAVAPDVNAKRVPVVVSTWLEGARELHVTPDALWIAVDAFEPSGGGRQVPRGAAKDAAQSDALWAELVDLVVTHSELEGELVRGVKLEPNDGDLVEHGDAVRVIGVSAPGRPRPLGEWVARCLVPSAQCSDGPVVWPRMERALDVFAAAAERNPRLPAAADCIDAAIRFSAAAAGSAS